MITSNNAEETEAFAEQYVRSLAPGAVVALVGDLGAGKTQFVRGMARGLECASEVSSPTFLLIQEYSGGKLPLYHVDLYRLEKAEELEEIALDEYFDSEGITAVEWADKFPDYLPPETRWIHFRILKGDQREIHTGDRPS